MNLSEWKTNPYLPEGWLCKESLTKSWKLQVLTSEGLKFFCYKYIIEFIKNDPKYSEIYISTIYIYLDGKNLAPNRSTDKCKPNDFLPEGWLGKEKKDISNFLMDENGTKFASYKSAVEFKKAYPKYYVEDITMIYHYPDRINHAQYYMSEAWKPNDYLPKGWLGKEKKKGSNFMMDDNGTQVGSYRSAVEFTKLYPKYYKEDISMIYHYPDGVNHAQPNISGEWKQSHYLPHGWFGKEGKDGNKFLMNDNGKTFASYKSAVEDVKLDTTYSKQDIP